MQTSASRSESDLDLADLRAQSLSAIALFVGLAGYVWLLLAFWLHQSSPPPPAWIPPTIVATGAVVTLVSGRLWPQRSPALAGALIVLVFAAIAHAMVGFHSPDVAYLFVLGVSFTGVLLGQRATMLMSALAVILTATIGTGRLGFPIASAELGFPIAIIGLTAIGSWLSARNLYTALAWVWTSYDRARRNEHEARAQRSELRQALKALDEATYRLERANRILALARDQAEESRRLKQQFAQNISHELRTPLNLIVGFTELMAQSPDYYGVRLPPAFVRDLSTVHRYSRHLQTLIGDVLDLARIEAAQMALLMEEVDPAALVEEAVSTARSLVESRGLELRTEIEPGVPALRVDPIRIRQVLFNLLNNAARFTDTGSVTVSVSRQGDGVVFGVSDTGTGIAPEDIPRVFHEFQQLDGSMRRRHAGAGLGLAISKQFVELHHGRIWVESVPGEGSRFSFSLPICQPEPLLPREIEPGSLAQLNPVRWPEERVVLAVTRSPSAATLLTRYLQGYRVVVAGELAQARLLAQDLLPQAVVIDTASAEVPGADLEGLAQAWGAPGTIFTVCPLPGEEPLRQHLDVQGYLIKPVTRADLLDVLRQFGEKVDRVLIVDDDHDFCRLVRHMLDDPARPYLVSAAYSGREGLEKLGRQRPDLLLLDLVLPDIPGKQIIERVRSSPRWRSMPIVVVSGEEGIGNSGALRGSLVFAKAQGVRPGEVIQWLQSVLDSQNRRGRGAVPLAERGGDNGPHSPS